MKRLKVCVHPGDVYVTEAGEYSINTTFNVSYGTGDVSVNKSFLEASDGTVCTVIGIIDRMDRTVDGRIEKWCMFLVDGRVCYRYVDPLNENDHGLRRVLTM